MGGDLEIHLHRIFENFQSEMIQVSSVWLMDEWIFYVVYCMTSYPVVDGWMDFQCGILYDKLSIIIRGLIWLKLLIDQERSYCGAKQLLYA